MAGKDVSLRDITNLGFGKHTYSDAISADKHATEITSNHITNHVYGINHRQTPLPIPINKNHYGMTFFTRPQLNLQSNNIRHSRLFYPLLTTVDKSWQRLIRCTLDPRLAYGYGNTTNPNGGDQRLSCPLVDPEMAFIPLLSNSLISISGWKDITTPLHTSKAGQYKEEYSMVDGVVVDYTSYTVTANFRNLKGDPIVSMMHYWHHYQSLVFEGVLAPYPDMILANEIDYNTRIYRLVLDPTKRKVQHISACGAAIPAALSIGNMFDYAVDTPYNEANKEISVPFQAMGFIYNDDILIRAFNETVRCFQPDMKPSFRMATDLEDFYMPPDPLKMTKIPHNMLSMFNNRGYPRIDPLTYELEWYIKTVDYERRVQAIMSFDDMLERALGMKEEEEGEPEEGLWATT